MSFLSVTIIAVSLTYIISPIDLVPDYMPVLGWLDDGLVLYLLIKRVMFETQRFTRHKAMGRRSNQ